MYSFKSSYKKTRLQEKWLENDRNYSEEKYRKEQFFKEAARLVSKKLGQNPLDTT